MAISIVETFAPLPGWWDKPAIVGSRYLQASEVKRSYAYNSTVGDATGGNITFTFPLPQESQFAWYVEKIQLEAAAAAGVILTHVGAWIDTPETSWDGQLIRVDLDASGLLSPEDSYNVARQLSPILWHKGLIAVNTPNLSWAQANVENEVYSFGVQLLRVNRDTLTDSQRSLFGR